jgi:hypothetical protein
MNRIESRIKNGIVDYMTDLGESKGVRLVARVHAETGEVRFEG